MFLDTAFIASSEAAATKHFMDNFTVETVADDLYRLLPP